MQGYFSMHRWGSKFIYCLSSTLVALCGRSALHQGRMTMQKLCQFWWKSMRNIDHTCRLHVWVVPLLLSLLCVMRKKTVIKNDSAKSWGLEAPERRDYRLSPRVCSFLAEWFFFVFSNLINHIQQISLSQHPVIDACCRLPWEMSSKIIAQLYPCGAKTCSEGCPPQAIMKPLKMLWKEDRQKNNHATIFAAYVDATYKHRVSTENLFEISKRVGVEKCCLADLVTELGFTCEKNLAESSWNASELTKICDQTS